MKHSVSSKKCPVKYLRKNLSMQYMVNKLRCMVMVGFFLPFPMSECYKSHCRIASFKEKEKFLGTYMYICFILDKKKTVLIVHFACGFSLLLITVYILKKERRSGTISLHSTIFVLTTLFC